MNAQIHPAAQRRRWLALLILRLGLAAVFLYAGAVKAWSPELFADSIASFQLLPARAINLLALGLPPFEILAGLLLLVPGKLQRTGALCILLMTLVFLFALASALIRGLTVDCGCFGGNGLAVLAFGKNLWPALGRDLLLGAVAWLLYTDASRALGFVPPMKTHAQADSSTAAP